MAARDGADAQLRAELAEARAELARLRDAFCREGRSDVALRESENRFRAAFEQGSIGMALIDRELQWIEVNEALAVMLGYDRATFRRQRWVDMTHPDDVGEEVRLAGRLLAGEIEEYTLEKRARHRDGRYLIVRSWVKCIRRSDGSAGQLLAILEDITHRREVEEALRHSEASLAKAQELARVGSFEWDFVTDRIEWSDEMYRIFGLDRTGDEPMSFHAIMEHIHPEDRPWVTATSESSRHSGRPHRLEFRIVRPDGTVRFVRSDGQVQVDPAAGPVSMFGTIQDVTAQRRSAEKLRDYQRRLQGLASQLSAAEERERRRLAATLHDGFGQSLYALKTKVGLLRLSEQDPARCRLLDETLADADELMRQTRNLTFELCPPILYEVGLEAALEWLAERFQERTGVTCAFADDGQDKPLHEEASGMAYQAARELLVNVEKHAGASWVEVAISREAGSLHVIVRDNGRGVGGPGQEGPETSGFGLFNIRERLRQAGGELEIRSAEGQGCQAIVVLPLREREQPQETSP